MDDEAIMQALTAHKRSSTEILSRAREQDADVMLNVADEELHLFISISIFIAGLFVVTALAATTPEEQFLPT